MRVLLLYNPISGTGQGESLASALAEHLDAATMADHAELAVTTAPTRLEPTETWLDPLLEGVDLLVVLGGDGAMRMAAPSAIRQQVAIIQYPAGTENLFARAFGMRANPAQLIETMQHGHVAPIDVGTVNGELMLLCASVGLDAEVVHDLARTRKGAITHSSYIRPTLRQCLRWRKSPPAIEVSVDGVVVSAAQPGIVLIANLPQYAVGLNPAKNAINDDGLLDVVFLPARSLSALVAWGIRCKRGTQLQHPAAVCARGALIEVALSEPGHVQLDGDPSHDRRPVRTLTAQVQPQVLQVLRPASENGSV